MSGSSPSDKSRGKPESIRVWMRAPLAKIIKEKLDVLWDAEEMNLLLKSLKEVKKDVASFRTFIDDPANAKLR